ncbi:MAG: energy transducer TonB [Fidelibacterota bacterium]|nr:MAG: energy transducer TonB [Candidatus Neomarinimicrobiota bacterium]
MLACHPVRDVGRRYISPQLESDDFTAFYPPEAYEKGLEGKVELLLRIELSGDVSEALIAKSSGHDDLDNAALSMAQIMHFKPGQIGGEPRALWVKIPVIFSVASKLVTSIDLEEWRRMVLKYRSAAAEGDSHERQIAQKEVLRCYVRLANNMVSTRSVAPNSMIMAMVAPPIRDSWIEYQAVLPFSFVLFQDFLHRYPDSECTNLAEGYLRDYLVYEVSQLQPALSADSPAARVKRRLLRTLAQ